MAGKYPDRIRSLERYDGRFDAFQLKAEGADVLFASYPAGTTIPAHTHETDNYGVIIRGELILTINGERKRFGIGDWYCVPANAEHSAEFEVETDEIEFWFPPRRQK
jgi:quercetin dioxygenase-like cupin family protein